jgi:hypothetical protein
VRQNQHDRHPLWFALYGMSPDGFLAYHHGAGFRDRGSRLDPLPAPPKPPTAGASRFSQRVATYRFRRDTNAAQRSRARASAQRARDDDAVFAELMADPEFFRQFL